MRQQRCLQSLQLSGTYSAGDTSRIRLTTFHYDSAVLHDPAVGNADCRLGHFQMQTEAQYGPRTENYGSRMVLLTIPAPH